MPKPITKRNILKLIVSLKDDHRRNALIAMLIESGELSDRELAELIVIETHRNVDRYADLLKTDAVFRYLCERFRHAPQLLARALVRVMPELFWHYGLAYRVVLKLRASLGPVYVPPRGPRGFPKVARHPLDGIDALVRKDLLQLDVERIIRQYLFAFQEDPRIAREILRDEWEHGGSYEREVIDAVEAAFARFLEMEFPGVVTDMNGSRFPAVHVRWWIDHARHIPRVLNIGDTNTFKTSFGFVGLDAFGARKALVICAPNARQLHARECGRYFVDGARRVQVLEQRADLDAFVRQFGDYQFHIVGWSSLADDAIVDALETLAIDSIFIDECQYGKSVTGSNPAKRALAMLRLGRKPSVTRVLACSATPWENRPEELAAVACCIRPDLFPTPEVFATSGLTDTPRVLRELFAENVLDVDIRDVRDLPDITPKPWEDLFGAVAIPMTRAHTRLYQVLHDDAAHPRTDIAKAQVLLQAAVHPPLVRDALQWPADIASSFDRWQTSSKLAWLKQFIDERINREKIVIATGIFATGITRPDEEDDTTWVGAYLQEWYGDRVLILDAEAAAIGPRRDAIIRRWREDATVRLLLVAIPACPDSLNLSVPAHPSVTRLTVTTLSCGWKPWKQFLGRFHREGQGVPIVYVTPILHGTIDEDLLRLNQEKWHVQQLFRANVPLTGEEWGFLTAHGADALHGLTRKPWEIVNAINNVMRGLGEDGCTDVYATPHGVRSHAEVFAEAFLASEEGSASDNIARDQGFHLRRLLDHAMCAPEQILDAGCGLLRLERRLAMQVVSVDMNPFMIDLARSRSPCGGANASVGRLSALPTEWTGRFFLTNCSLVLDWSSLVSGHHGDPAERIRILRELVRVTHPHGQLWLAFTEDTMDEQTWVAWRDMFRAHRFVVDPFLSGRRVATDGERPFAYWSLVVTPNGQSLGMIDPDALRFPYEVGRMVIRERRRRGTPIRTGERRAEIHHAFAVESPDLRKTIASADATEESIHAEVLRWIRATAAGHEVGRSARLPRDRYHDIATNWRILDKLIKLGIEFV